MRNFIVTIEGKQYQVGVQEVSSSYIPVVPVAVAPATVSVPLPVVAAPAPVAAPVSQTPVAKPSVSSADGVKLTSPMPGMIKKFNVQEGSQVKKGQAVVVLETMKMENDIASPKDGTISYKVALGSNVESGDVLAVIS